jgi:predicted acyl esterase
MNIDVKPAARAYALLIDKDVDVPMRDGARLKADVFRPDDAGKFPAILNLGPYQKDKLWVPPPTLEEKPNPYMNWETVNPEWWVPKGYAAVRVDGRGSGKSPGQCEPWSLQEAIDFYDAIEWAAKQSWCNDLPPRPPNDLPAGKRRLICTSDRSSLGARRGLIAGRSFTWLRRPRMSS